MSWPEAKRGEVYYPESDGEPMAETDRHRDLMVDLIAAARHYFRDRPDVYVSGNLLVYFVEGDPRQCVAPDFFVVRGVPKGKRRIFKIWEEGKSPDVVIELTSRKTHREDLREKRAIYEQLGVREYYIFDPEGIRFDPPFRAFRLDEGTQTLEPVPATQHADGTLVFTSEVLRLELHGRGQELRLVETPGGVPIPTSEEFAAMAGAERRRAEAAEAELARLRQKLDHETPPD